MFRPDPRKSTIDQLPARREVLNRTAYVFERRLSKHDLARIEELHRAEREPEGESR